MQEKLEIKLYLNENEKKTGAAKESYEKIATVFSAKWSKRVTRDSIWRVSNTDIKQLQPVSREQKRQRIAKNSALEEALYQWII